MGQYDPIDLTHAICAGFHKRPDHCKRNYIKDYLTNREDWDIPEYGFTMVEEIVLLGVLIIGLNIICLAYCKHR